MGRLGKAFWWDCFKCHKCPCYLCWLDKISSLIFQLISSRETKYLNRLRLPQGTLWLRNLFVCFYSFCNSFFSFCVLLCFSFIDCYCLSTTIVFLQCWGHYSKQVMLSTFLLTFKKAMHFFTYLSSVEIINYRTSYISSALHISITYDALLTNYQLAIQH